MLDAMRKYSTSIIVKILFLLLVLSFVIWGIADVFRPSGSGSWLAKVDKTQIPLQAFKTEYDNALRRLGQAIGAPIDREQARSLGLAENVLNSLIDRTLLDKAAADLGVTINDEVVRAHITGDQRFRGPSGQFDKMLFEETLRRNGLTEQGYVALLSGELVRRQLIESVIAGIAVPRELTDQISLYQGERRVADYVVVADAAGGRPPTPDDAALRQFYDDHVKQFTAPEYRQVMMVALELADFVRAVTVSDDELRKAYADSSAKLGQPERRSLRQIVFVDEAAAKAGYDRIVGGASFADVARDAGNDPPGLGPVSRQQLPGELGEAVFSAPATTVAPPVKSPLGWHLIEVTRIEPATVPPFERLRDELANDLKRQKAGDVLIDAGNKLEEALAKGATLEEAAHGLGLKPKVMPPLDANGKDDAGAPVAGLPARFAEALFATDEGRETGLVEAGPETVFIARVDKVIAAAPRPFPAVEIDVRAAWNTEQQKKLAQALAQTVAEDAKSGKPLATAAVAHGLKAVTSKPFTRTGEDRGDIPAELVTATFATAPGQVTIVRSGDGYIIARVVSADASSFDPGAPAAAALRSDLARRLREDLLTQFVAGLRNDHPVTVNRQLLDQQL